MRIPNLLLALLNILIIFLFSRIQDFNIQHLYLLLPVMLYFMYYFVDWLYNRLRQSIIKSVLLLLTFVLSIYSFISAVDPKTNGIMKRFLPIFSKLEFFPSQRTDLQSLYDLTQYLHTLPENSDDKIYILSSSFTLNSEIFSNINHYYSSLPIIRYSVLKTREVDMRDGFPEELFFAKYVVVTKPIQIHLHTKDQQIILKPAEQILDAYGIGKYYERLPDEFMLENNVHALVYERISPVPVRLIQELKTGIFGGVKQINFFRNLQNIAAQVSRKG